MPIEKYSHRTAENNDGCLTEKLQKSLVTTDVTSNKNLRYKYNYR